jgi:hypothetical protein
MVAAEMVLTGDALQGSRTRATTVARDGGVTGGEEDKKTERTCGGMEQKEIGPPVGTLGDVRRAQWVKGAGIRERPQENYIVVEI